MQFQLLVERDQNECIVNLAGTAYKFKRNDQGHLVSDITDHDDIKWISDPFHQAAFKEYGAPSKKIIEEVIDEVVVGKVVEEVEGTPVVVADKPVPGTIAENEAARPPYPQKGSKRPPKGSKR